VEDLQALWKIWIPVTLFNFCFSPLWLRIPVVATTSLLWTCVISYMRGANSYEEDLEEVNEAELGSSSFTYRWPKKRLDQDHSHLVVTFTGKDQMGLLSKITSTVVSRGGAIQESKVMSFGDSFAIMFLISSAQRDKATLESAIDQLSLDSNINTNILEAKYTDTIWKCSEERAVFRIHFTGPDTGEGLLSSITSIVSDHGFNIEKMKSGPACDNKHGSGGRHLCQIGLTVSHRDIPELNEVDLERKLFEFADSHGFSFEFVPVEVSPSVLRPPMMCPELDAASQDSVMLQAGSQASSLVAKVAEVKEGITNIAAELQAAPNLAPTI